MALDLEFLSMIVDINWFSNCGNIDKPHSFKYVKSWDSCRSSLASPEWEETTLEASNTLSDHLFENHHSAYQKWNSFAEDGREFLETNIKANIMTNGKAFPLDDISIDCIKWDILHAILEHQYRHISGHMHFFRGLLDVYLSGHFPCGWSNGPWPKGELVVF